jgi:hypothetical protein
MQSGIPEQVQEAFQAIGTSHIVVLSVMITPQCDLFSFVLCDPIGNHGS